MILDRYSIVLARPRQTRRLATSRRRETGKHLHTGNTARCAVDSLAVVRLTRRRGLDKFYVVPFVPPAVPKRGGRPRLDLETRSGGTVNVT